MLTAPSLEDIGGLNIEPVCTDGQFGAPPELTVFPLAPLRLEPNEFVRAFVQSTPGGAVRHFVLAWFSDSILLPLNEAAFTVAATASIAQQNFRWMSGPITFEQSLPVGRYVVLGMRCRALTGIAARLIFRGQLGRPGGPIVSAVTEPDDERFRRGNMGVWGSFLQEDPPLLDVYHGTAVAQDIILDLVRF